MGVCGADRMGTEASTGRQPGEGGERRRGGSRYGLGGSGGGGGGTPRSSGGVTPRSGGGGGGEEGGVTAAAARRAGALHGRAGARAESSDSDDDWGNKDTATWQSLTHKRRGRLNSVVMGGGEVMEKVRGGAV